MSNKRITILKNQLSQIELFIPLIHKKNPKVSKSTIGWQLDHALKVFNAVSKSTKNSNPKEYERKFNFWRTILFPIGYFPRGKARAPKYVLPPEIITLDDLNTQLLVAKENINTLNSLNKAMYFKHPIFGMLAKKQTLRFLEMHTNHHLKIINDILKN
tara:strand:- start:899 stop:1372 length:474 start_codon:yes stop_codon:yes gene_type:complete